MSEETNNEGGLSGLKKTVIGTLTTIIGGAGIWVSTHLFGGESEDKEETKTEQVAQPAAAPIVANVSNNNTNQQKQQGGGTTTIIKEKTVEKQSSPAQPAATPAKPKEEDPW